jgi:hypothetical protein
MHYIADSIALICLTTIKHYYFGKSLASLILSPFCIWYYKIIANYYFSYIFKAIILKTPFNVIIAIKSPRKLDHFMPSMEAECKIQVGNTLYIF